MGAPEHDSNESGSHESVDWRSSTQLAAVVHELASLAARFAAAGQRLYLVGGTVRDLVANDRRADFDLDLTTTARPPEIKRLLQGWADAIWTQGERFGTIGATKTSWSSGHRVERVIEITTHRAEAYRDDSRKPDVQFSDDVVADLSRRDFTVNAMAVELTVAEPELVDPFDGAGDMARRVLRTPLRPTESFSDDPLRMLRAARFISRHGLVPVPDLVEAVQSMAGRLSIVSAERVRDELDKLVRCPAPAVGLGFVLDTGLASEVLPELTGRAVDVVASIDSSRRTARWAAVFSSADELVARSRMRALRASTADVDDVGRVVSLRDRWFAPARFTGAARGGAVKELSEADLRRLVHDAGPALEDLLVLVEASAQADAEDPVDAAIQSSVRSVRERVERWAASGELTSLEPELDGVQVMELLGIAPGRNVGRALAFLLALRLDEGRLGSTVAADRLQRWWLDQQR